MEDSPSRLILEVEVPSFRAEPGFGGTRIIADGFEQASGAGAPDLPWHRFQVAVGRTAPTVTVEPLEWVEMPVRSLAATPRWITSRKPEAFRDPALFSSAGSLAPDISGIQNYRGLGLRGIGIPLGTYREGSGVRMLKRFRVHVVFPDAKPRVAVGTREWLQRAGVKNAWGGQYLVTAPRRAVLGKQARGRFALGSAYLKIRIGDRALDGLNEDGVHALRYETAVAAAPGLLGVSVRSLRMYAGPQDTLKMEIDSVGGPLGPSLRQIPIAVEDNDGDSTFDAGDRILFYGHGTGVWKPIPGAVGPVSWRFGSDPFSFDNFYYLDWSGSDTASPLRLSQASLRAGVADTVTSAPHYLRAERDVQTGSCDPSAQFDDETGYDWYWHWRDDCTILLEQVVLSGPQLRGASGDTLDGYAGDSLWVGFFVFEQDTLEDFTPWIGGAPLVYTKLEIAPLGAAVPGSWYAGLGSGGGRLGLDSLRWMGINTRFEGYTVRYNKNLIWRGRPQTVFPAAANRWTVYKIAGGAGLRCLRLESGIGVQWLAVSMVGGDAVFSDSIGAGEDVVYFLYGGAMELAPGTLALEQIPAAPGVIRNYLDGDGMDPEYLIVAPQALLAEALEFRQYRNSASRPSAVARLEDVYREWSGGRLSPMAIRDMLRWGMHRWGNGGMGRLRTVFLFGDGHYDYRDLLNGTARNPLPNHVPPFNWDNPQDLDNPMSTDDYYGVMDSAESWRRGATLDLAVGRLPVQTAAQARDYLDKIRAYENPRLAGEWRGRITLTADDIMQRDRRDPVISHTTDSEQLGQSANSGEPGLRLDKIYLLDYPVNTAFLKPEATQDLLDNINRGTLLTTFFGHGAYNQLADEVLLQTNDALSRLRNAGKAFAIGIFSCTVGRFDKLQDEGMTEQFVKQKDYGSIIGVAGSRETYPGDNLSLGKAFVSRLFPGEDSIARGAGEVLRLAKNSLGPDFRHNKQKYSLLGDPAAVIRRPGLGLTLDVVPDTLRALGCDTLRGRVLRGSGRGFVNIRIVGGDVHKVYQDPFGSTSLAAEKRGPILFERTVAYSNFTFNADFFLPKHVPIGDTLAKIELFAWDSIQLLESTLLVPRRFIQGVLPGGACAVDRDGRGPRIAVTGCNLKESGGVDFPDRVRITLPYCLQLDVSDSVGGVMAGEGPDEGTTVEFVGMREPYHPQPGVDDLYRKAYQIPLQRGDLLPGRTLLKVTARDGFGNMSLRQIALEISADTVLRAIQAYNAPNPMKRNGTAFYFSAILPDHAGGAQENPLNDRLRFDLFIYDQGGRLVRKFPDAVSGLRWDGRDAWGQNLANGIYFYEVSARWDEDQGAPERGQKASRRNTLVLSR